MVGDKARVIIVSTPNGRANWFWQQFDRDNGDINADEIRKKIIKGDLPPFYYWVDDVGTCKIFVHHKAHPIYGHDPDYLEKVKAKYKLTDQLLQREYNFGLDDTDATVFNLELVRRATRGNWQTKLKNHKYLVVVS